MPRRLCHGDDWSCAGGDPAANPATKQTAPCAGSKAAAPVAAAKPAAAPAAKAATPKAGAEPDRKLNRRSTYAGVVDIGPVAGETFEQKITRLKAVAAAAKQRAEEGGEPTAAVSAPDSPVAAAVLESAMTPADEADTAAAAPAQTAAPSETPKPTGQADRSLMIRSTYCGVVDTGPVSGETFEQKVERLRAVAAAAKQRAEGG